MNHRYTEQQLTYTDDGRLLDANGLAVMMEWERPVMQLQARVVAGRGGDILNVGFGMGIIDSYIRTYSPATHTIIEVHPDVYFRMLSEGWLRKPGVIPLFGDWRAYLHYLPKYDGIYIDTWDEEFGEFLEYAPHLLKPDGVLSFFNNPRGDEDGAHLYPAYVDVCHRLYHVAFETMEIPHVSDQSEQSPGRVGEEFYWKPEWRTYYCPILTAMTLSS